MRRALVVLCAAACASCGSVPFPPYTLADDAARREELARRSPRPPDTAALVSLRMTVELPGAQQALTLHGLVFPPASLYFQSINDWGGSGFALRRDSRGARGLNTPAYLPEAFWEACAEALAVALAPPSAAGASLARGEAGEWMLALRRGEEEILIAPGGEDDPVRYDVGSDGWWRSSARITGWLRGADGRRICPRGIEIIAHEDGIRAHAEVFAWEPSDASEQELRREFEQAFNDR